MIQAKEIVGTYASKNALEWGRETLQRHLAEVLALRDDVLDSADIEGVHQMRVAIRRLRSALRNFSSLMKSNPFKESKKDLKRLANTLGTARDQDVTIAALEKLHNKAKNERIKKNLAEKIEKHRIVREEIQSELSKILDVSLLENLRENFSKALNKVNEKNVKVAKLTAGEAGRKVISKNIHEFCDLSESLLNPFNQEKLHQLRIAAKRLRYAIELFAVCWGEQILPFANKISDMQDYLGELHDNDLWIVNLSRRLNKKKKKQRTDFWLLSKFTKRRTKNYRAALCLWSKWQKNKFLPRLEEVLQTD